MEYIVVLVLAGVIVVIFLVGFLGGAKKLETGKLPADAVKPPSKPSADAPTPARSVVEDKAQIDKARQHTPPA